MQFSIYSQRQVPHSITALSESLRQFIPAQEIKELKHRIRTVRHWNESYFEKKYLSKILRIILLSYLNK